MSNLSMSCLQHIYVYLTYIFFTLNAKHHKRINRSISEQGWILDILFQTKYWGAVTKSLDISYCSKYNTLEKSLVKLTTTEYILFVSKKLYFDL